MPTDNKLSELVEVAEIANLLVSIATGAGVPIIGLVSTIASNFTKGKEISAEDIAGSIARAKQANESLGRAIDARR